MSDTTGHRLSEVDPIQKTAVCAKCGPTKIYYNDYGDRITRRCKGAALSVGRVKAPKNHRVLEGVCGICGPVTPIKGKCPASYAIRERARKVFKSEYQELRIKTDVKQALREGKHCEICDGGPEISILVIDHKQGEVEHRGVLCNRCNAGLGMFAEEPALLRSAAEYLEKAQKHE